LDEVQLTAGPDRAVVDPAAGGRLSSLIAGGRERLVGPPADASQRLSTLWGCFPMAPWAGRIADGRLEWEGQSYGLRRNAGGHSLHGVVFDVPWMVMARNEGRVEMTAGDLPGWPFEGVANQRVELAPGRLELRLEVVAGEPMPAWVGWHPWFRRPESGDMHVRVIAARILETREGLIPTGRFIDVGGPTDLRDGPALGDRRLDHVYADAKSPATISWPDLELTMQLEPPLATVVVHTPERGVCVEPQTAWPDALRLGDEGNLMTGLRRLGAGETLRGVTIWKWS
jgi:aldose 1-epimerase